MQRFYYNDQRQLTQLLDTFSEVSGKYCRKDVDTEKALKGLLDKVITRYREGGFTDRESQAQLLRAELATAERGIHPHMHERVTLRKGDMKMGVQLKILQTLDRLLREEYATGAGRLQEARDLIAQVLLAGLQGGLIKPSLLYRANTEQKLQTIWKMLSTDANLQLVQKRVLMTVSMPDILLLLDELATQMRHA